MSVLHEEFCNQRNIFLIAWVNLAAASASSGLVYKEKLFPYMTGYEFKEQELFQNSHLQDTPTAI